MDREDHDRELTLLRRRLAVLTEEARKNDDAWRRAQAREMELLEADTLDALLERLTSGLRDSYRLEACDLGRRRYGSRDPTLVVVARVRRRPRRAACCSWTPCTASRRRSLRAAGRGSASSIARITHCCFRRRGARKRGVAAADAPGAVDRLPEFRQPRARAVQSGARHGVPAPPRRHRCIRARKLPSTARGSSAAASRTC